VDDWLKYRSVDEAEEGEEADEPHQLEGCQEEEAGVYPTAESRIHELLQKRVDDQPKSEFELLPVIGQ